MPYDFSSQAKLFTIALEILEDYNISDWSFGGGTALSSIYYKHRMSYDIDIFLEDFSSMQVIVEYQEEIARNLGVNKQHIKSSPTGVTFTLDADSHGLKLDFVYSPALSSNPYNCKTVFGFKEIKTQTPLEIIAKKLKFREKATIRDFVDYAVSQEQDEIMTKLKYEGIVDIERYFEVIEKFDKFDANVFNAELKLLFPNKELCKDDFAQTISSIMKPGNLIKIALDSNGELVAFDEFIPTYQKHYAPLGKLQIFEIANSGLSYKELMDMSKEEIKSLIVH